MSNRGKKIFIIIVSIIILFFINPRTINYIKAKTGPGEGNISIVKEIDTTHSSQIIYERLDSGLIQYWEGILIYYNTNGEQVWSINLGITRPVIKTNSNSIYVVDEGKNQIICINKDGQQVYKSTLDKPYKNFSISDDNYVALYHSTDSPVQYVTILNDKGAKSGEITLADGQITNLAISNSSNKMAVSTIGVKGDTLENNVSIYDLKGNLLGVENLKNNIILNIFYSDKGNLLVVDEKNIFNIDKDNKVRWDTSFDESINLINATNKEYITLYSKGNNKNSIIYSSNGNKIKTIGYDGKLVGEIKIKEDILGLDSHRNDIIAYSLRTVFKYTKNGTEKFEYPYSSDILKTFALSEKNIVVITKEKITFLTYNKK